MIARERHASLGWWLAGAAVLLCGFALRLAYHGNGYPHPDEPIAYEVIKYMRQSGDWDTNWAKSALEPNLRYDQYNFSSYHYATFLFYRLVKLIPGTEAWRGLEDGFYVYRFFSVALALLAVWQTMRLGARLGGRAIGLGVGALAAVALLLVQDAHYVRPEAFTTVLTLAVVGLCWPREKLHAGAVLGAGALIGLLAACKVSMLLLVWLPLVPLSANWRETKQRWLVLGALPLAVAAGFAVGAPGAVAHPAKFLYGVQQLMAQYAGIHPPHGHRDGGPVADILTRYFSATLGLPVLACFALGTVALGWSRRWMELALLAGTVLLFAGYFGTRSVFFERNLSHVVPLLLVVAAFGAGEMIGWLSRRTRMPLALLILVVAALLLARSVTMTGRLLGQEFSGVAEARHDDFERNLRAHYPEADWGDVRLDGAGLGKVAEHFRTSSAPVLVRVSDYGDEWTSANLSRLTTRFATKLVGDFPATFPEVPVCTLTTYFRPHDRYYLVTGTQVP